MAENDTVDVDAEIAEIEAGLNLDPEEGSGAEDVAEGDEEIAEATDPEEGVAEEPAPEEETPEPEPTPAPAPPPVKAKAAPAKPKAAAPVTPAVPAPAPAKVEAPKPAAKPAPAPAKPKAAAPAKPTAPAAAEVKPPAAKPVKAPAGKIAKAKAAADVSATGAAAQAAKATLAEAATEEAATVAEAAPTETKTAAKAATGVSVGDQNPTVIVMAPLDSITVPSKRRQRDVADYSEEAIASLAASIKRHGLISPIVTSAANPKGKRILRAGERRLSAAKLLGWTAIPTIEIAARDDAHAAMIGFVENAERKPVNPLSEAEYFQALLDAKVFAEQKTLAKEAGYTPSRLSQILSRLELNDESKKALKDGKISARDAESMVAAAKKSKAAAEAAKAAKKAEKEAAGAAPAEAEEAAEEAGEEAGEEAAAGKIDPASTGARRGPPRKRVDLKDLTNPTLTVSDSVGLVLHRLPDGTFDLEVALRIGIGEGDKFRPETFALTKSAADALKTEINPHAKEIAVAIESAIRVLSR